MLKLTKINKDYITGDTTVEALRGLDLKFRKSEFVAVLGPSGCGKTTLLNIIGGLDRYTSGDLMINGKSTKEYTDSDWDTYRNHSIGFVFQSYNLISHQTVLSNVELALTLSGVSKEARRKKAIAVLSSVGIADQMHKKPYQLSGGQMQRVAIARALINDPDILLADEPTGALDTETSVQIMDILAQVAREKLVIMVTHNPDLAHKYANRTIKLLDGVVIDDTNPYEIENVAPTYTVGEGKQDKKQKRKKEKARKPSMSFMTALSLSLNNLLTKKTRTILTSFAGSIGIIGIALILSLSSGFQAYITRVEEDTLSSYPMSIQKENMDISSLISSMTGNSDTDRQNQDPDKIYSNDITLEMFSTMQSQINTNNLEAFKKFIESKDEIKDLSGAIQYTYNINLQIFNPSSVGGSLQVNPSSVLSKMGMGGGGSPMMGSFGGMNIFQEMIGNDTLLQSQYNVIAGKWPSNKNEVVLVVNKDNEINDLSLFALGIRDPGELTDIFNAIMKGEKYEKTTTSFTYEELLNTEFSVLVNTDLYDKADDGVWKDMRDDSAYVDKIIKGETSVPLRVVGILRPAEGVNSTSITGVVGYTKDLTDYIIGEVNKSTVVAEQKANPKMDILKGLPFDDGVNSKPSDEAKIAMFKAYVSTLNDTEKAELMRKIAAAMTEDERQALIDTQFSIMTEEDKTAMINKAIDKMTKADIIAMMQQAGTPAQTIEIISAMEEAGIKDMMKGMYAPSDDAEKKAMRDEFVLGVIINEEINNQYHNDKDAAEDLDLKVGSADDETLLSWFKAYMPPFVSESTLEKNLDKLGAADFDNPASINIYPVDFAAKERLAQIIEEYNNSVVADPEKGETYKISYTDYIGLFMSSISTIIDTISIVLIAFVGISLFVSSIMIGIITYISVLERTKEIGVLRSIGASKRDISRVFNAETIIVGFVAGLLGIGTTLLINIPVNIVIKALSKIPNVARLPIAGSIALIIVSVGLTFIAGLIPAKLAAKKDPVVALRTE